MRAFREAHWYIPAVGVARPLQGSCGRHNPSTSVEVMTFLPVRVFAAVMLTPGSAMDMEGYVRIGYANRREVLVEGLSRVSGFLKKP